MRVFFKDALTISLVFTFLMIGGCQKAPDAKTQIKPDNAKSASTESAKLSQEKAKTDETPIASTEDSSTKIDLKDQTSDAVDPSTAKSAKTEPVSKPVAEQSPGAPVAATKSTSDPADSVTEKQNKQPTQPAFVTEVLGVLNFADWPKPQDAGQDSVYQTGMYYQTAEDSDHVMIGIQEEMRKRGFTEGESLRTQNSSITIKIDDRPSTIFLASSISGNKTIVTMYHHQGIDMSKVPHLETIGEIDRRVDRETYVSPIGVREGQSLLRSEIEKLGIEIARTSTNSGVAKAFSKGNLKVICHVEDAHDIEFEYPKEGTPKYTRVAMVSRSNVDVSELPVPGQTESSPQPYNSIFGNYEYITAEAPAAIIKECKSELTKSGWTPVEAFRESISDKQALLLSNGTILQVGATEYQNGRTHVQYSLTMLPFDLPKGIDTRQIRVDTAAPKMFFITPADVKQVTDFYTIHLPTIGWKAEDQFRLSKTDQHKQLYRGNHYEPVLLDVKRKDADSTWVELRPIPVASIARTFFEEKKAEEKPEPETLTKPEQPDVESVAGKPDMPAEIEKMMKQQVEEALKNLPPEQAAEARKMIESSLAGAAADSLKEAAGEADEPEQKNDPEDEEEMIEETITNSPEAIPADKIAAQEFQMPDGASNISRDFEMITFSAKTVEPNAKFFTKMLKEKGWKTRGDQMIESDMAMLRFQKGTGTINVSLILDDRKDPPVHGVIQGDGLHFPGSDEYSGGEFEMENEDFDAPEGFETPTDFEGLALPKNITDNWKSGSQFRQEMNFSIESDLKTIYDHFRNATKDSDWNETSQMIAKDENATIKMSNGRGELIVTLKRFEGEVEANLAFRDPDLAKKHGFLPPSGKCRVILGNASDKPATIVIGKKTYELAAQQGANDPKEGIVIDLSPGDYEYAIKAAGRDDQSDKLKLVADGTWGVIVFPEDGHMAERMY